jgi:hypothetical protein
MNQRGKDMRFLGTPWLSISVVIGSIITLILALNLLFGVPGFQAATAVGSVATAIGVFLAFLALRNTHEWNRRNYTAEFLDDWNENASQRLAILAREFPKFFAVPDFITNPGLRNSWCLDQARAEQLVKLESEQDRPTCNELGVREHLIALFNYFEGIAIAYELHVVDRAVIEDSVSTVILDTCVYFQPFIDEMRKINRRDPWPPLSRVVERWLAEATWSKAQEGAIAASQRYREALRKSEENLRPPTGI